MSSGNSGKSYPNTISNLLEQGLKSSKHIAEKRLAVRSSSLSSSSHTMPTSSGPVPTNLNKLPNSFYIIPTSFSFLPTNPDAQMLVDTNSSFYSRPSRTTKKKSFSIGATLVFNCTKQALTFQVISFRNVKISLWCKCFYKLKECYIIFESGTMDFNCLKPKFFNLFFRQWFLK